MNRREFLQTCAAGGLLPAVATSPSTASTGSVDRVTGELAAATTIEQGTIVTNQDQYADEPNPEIAPEYEPKTTSVDADLTAELTASRRLSDELLDRLESLVDGAETASVSRQSTANGLRLFIECPPTADTEAFAEAVETLRQQFGSSAVADQLPDRIETVDVAVRSRPETRPEIELQDTVGRFADARYRANGIAMGAAARSETVGKIASTGFRGLRDGHAVVVTTAHTFERRDGQDPTELRGAELYQSRRPYSVGRCYALGRTHETGLDAAAVTVDTATYPSRYLADPGGNSYNEQPIVGTASWSLLEAHQADNRPIYKQGSVSGRREGRIIELREHTDGYRELALDIHSEGGDSGGPYLVETDEGLLVAGIHKGVRSGGTERRGIFVGSVLDALDIDIY